MSIELLTALIAGAVAIVAAIMGYRAQVRASEGQVRITKLEHELTQQRTKLEHELAQRRTKLEHELARQREQESREAQVEAIMVKYRDPLFRAAFDLQSRFYNTVQQGFLQVYYHRSDVDRDYAIQSTLFVIAQYLGWVEILRREVQFLDLGDVELNRRFVDLLDNVTAEFSTDSIDLTYRLFRGEQRAIGEIMIAARPVIGGENEIYECIGYATFISRLDDQDFMRWFVRLQDDIDRLAAAPHEHEERLIVLQHKLIELIDFLDPNYVRVPENSRQKISSRR